SVVAVAPVLLPTVLPASEAAAPPPRTAPTPPVSRALVAHPIPFVLVGDSVALTLGVGLTPHAINHYGVRVYDAASLGCDLDDVEVRLSDVVGPPTPGCIGWRSTWRNDVKRFHPDVVGLLIGRWEVSDHYYEGHWVHIGDPVWDR